MKPTTIAAIALTIVAILIGIIAAKGADAPASFVSYSFTWNNNTETNLAGYRVRWGMTNSQTGFVKTVTTNFVTVNFSNSVPHWLHVTAFNTAGFESLPSPNLMVDLPGTPANGRAVAGTVISTVITNWVFIP